MTNTSRILFLLFLVVIGGIFLQIFFSKRQSKWFGLILPAITFLYSLLAIFGIAVYEGMSGGEIFVLIASTLFIANIPTVVLLIVYFCCRENVRRRSQLEKMNIQDLD